ncbi:hypothetical protein [Streptomyces sp. NPDC102487]|uniref:hypothetical protein n=1 Tax=Streptomyces sp. NPDC102487 TaxID=3366182 RepID=UPI00382D5CF7
MTQRQPLLWAALAAVLVVLASAEYELAVACGFGAYVAAGVPAALDIYAIAALRARRDVLVVVVALIAVNGASHLVSVGLLPVSVGLVVAVSAIAPMVLWRVHRLSEPQAEPAGPAAELGPEPSSDLAEPAEPITVERPTAAEPAIAPPVDTIPASLHLGPWLPVAELTRGTGTDLLGEHFRDAAKVVGGTPAEPTAEPVPVAALPLGPGAADIETIDSTNTTFEARVSTVRRWLETEPELTGTEIGTRLGVSDSYGRRVLRKARDGA